MNNPEELSSINSMSTEDLLPPFGRWITISNSILITSFYVAFAAAGFIRYDVVVKAPASVRPDGDSRIVQASTSGTIQKLLVSDNEFVRKNQVLAKIDNSESQTRKIQLQERVKQFRLQLDQINLESDAQKRANLSALSEARENLSLAKSDLEAHERLDEAAAIPKIVLRQKQQAYETSRLKVSELSARIKQQQASLQRSLIEVNNQVIQDQKQLNQIDLDLQKTDVLAPVDGNVIELNVRNIGQFIRVGEEFARITPTSALVVKAKVDLQDIRKVEICTDKFVPDCNVGKVKLQFSSYPHPDFGVLNGAVRSVSSDVITSGNNGAQPPYYEVTIEMEKPYFEVKGKRLPIKPGMDVTSQIISKEETFLKFLMRKAKLLADF